MEYYVESKGKMFSYSKKPFSVHHSLDLLHLAIGVSISTH